MDRRQFVIGAAAALCSPVLSSADTPRMVRLPSLRWIDPVIESLVPFGPAPVLTFEQFQADMLRRIAGAMALPYDMIVADLDGGTTAARQGRALN